MSLLVIVLKIVSSIVVDLFLDEVLLFVQPELDIILLVELILVLLVGFIGELGPNLEYKVAVVTADGDWEGFSLLA